MCVILLVFFRKQLGMIGFLLLIAIWFVSKHFWEVVSWPFRAVWWILTLPFRLIFSGGGSLITAMERQWYRDKSIFFAKLLVSVMVIVLCVKATGAIHHLFVK